MEEKSNCWEEQYQPHKEKKKDEDEKTARCIQEKSRASRHYGFTYDGMMAERRRRKSIEDKFL